MNQMSEFIREVFELSVLILLLVLLFVAIIIMIKTFGFSKYLSSRKYRISTHFEYEPISQKEMFTILVYNNNLTDSRLAALGYMYKHQTIDYYKTYLKQIDYSLEGKIVIPSRDSIKIKIDIDSLLAVINDYNYGKIKTKSLKCFVTDALGMTTTVKAKTVRKVIKRKLKKAKVIKRDQKIEQIKKQKQERLAQKKIRKEARVQKRLAKREKIRVWFKEKLNKVKRGS